MTDFTAKLAPETAARLASVVGPPKSGTLPSHVEEALQAMAAMHAAHHDQASPLENSIDRVIAAISAPKFVVYVVIGLVLWMAANTVLFYVYPSFADAPPFALLSVLVACIALLIAILILASQRRADKLANLREQMTLEMTLLTTQKVSKLIDLMEELRRDSPDVKDRIDLEAIEMAGMPDHETVLQAIQEISDTVAGPAA